MNGITMTRSLPRYSHVTSVTISFSILCTSTGCAGPPEGRVASPTLEVAIDTAADVVHVSNRGQPLQWSLEEVLTLGLRAGQTADPPPDEFGSVSGVIGDSLGRVYVADAQAAEIRVFDAEGHLARRIGGRGSGPGEFIALISIGWLGEHLAALDVGNARLGIMSPTGEWLGQRRMRAGDRGRLLPTGSDDLYVPNVRIDSAGMQLTYVLQTQYGPRDTLVPPAVEAVDEPSLNCVRAGGSITSRHRASFAPRRLLIPAPGLLWASARTSDYRVTFMTAEGDTVRVLDRDIPRRDVDDAAWQNEVAAFEQLSDEYPDFVCDQRSLPRPGAMELFREIFFDDSGRMWVERITGAGFALDAFDPTGKLLGQVIIPNRSERVLPYIDGDRLYLVTTDDLGVQRVHVYRIVGPGMNE